MYTPEPEHKFTFGLWTVGSIGRDLFGGPVRAPKTPAELVRLLGEVGAYGVNFHDNDLFPLTPPRQRRMPSVIDSILNRLLLTGNWICFIGAPYECNRNIGRTQLS